MIVLKGHYDQICTYCMFPQTFQDDKVIFFIEECFCTIFFIYAMVFSSFRGVGQTLVQQSAVRPHITLLAGITASFPLWVNRTRKPR